MTSKNTISFTPSSVLLRLDAHTKGPDRVRSLHTACYGLSSLPKELPRRLVDDLSPVTECSLGLWWEFKQRTYLPWRKLNRFNTVSMKSLYCVLVSVAGQCRHVRLFLLYLVRVLQQSCETTADPISSSERPIGELRWKKWTTCRAYLSKYR